MYRKSMLALPLLDGMHGETHPHAFYAYLQLPVLNVGMRQIACTILGAKYSSAYNSRHKAKRVDRS